MKKLFALLVVASLAAIGCDDKKSTGGKPDTTKTTPMKMETSKPPVVDSTKPKIPDGPKIPDAPKIPDPPKKADPPVDPPKKADPPVDPPKKGDKDK